MFSFHRPKVYRSSTGCCICKAKSSSSRFTDSKKYEEDFLECFQLSAPRQGEICNACVLLVKRWKKLPAGTDRNWRHVVDARAGPGMKSMTRYKSKSKKGDEKVGEKKKGGHGGFTRECSPALSDKSEPQDAEMVEMAEFLCEGATSARSSRTASPGGSDCEDNVSSSSSSANRRHKGAPKRRGDHVEELSEFIDTAFWKMENICCGTIFKGPRGELLLDGRFLKPCNARLAARCKLRAAATQGRTVAGGDLKAEPEISDSSSAIASKSYSDSSSDSGYDESSNHGYNSINNNNVRSKKDCLAGGKVDEGAAKAN